MTYTRRGWQKGALGLQWVSAYKSYTNRSGRVESRVESSLDVVVWCRVWNRREVGGREQSLCEMSILLMIPQDHSKLPHSGAPWNSLCLYVLLWNATARFSLSLSLLRPYGAWELVFPFVIFLMTSTRVPGRVQHENATFTAKIGT